MFSDGRNAFGFCDRCSFRYPLNDLVDQVNAGLETGLMVCPECNDEDNPQLLLGRIRFEDPEALRNPRPDSGEAESRGMFSFPIVGSGQISDDGEPAGFKSEGEVGSVTVTTT
jgi:hypothetical protein